MFEWRDELAVVGDRKYEPGLAPVKWYAYDLRDNQKLSPKAMQEGLTPEEASLLWQKKWWMLIKEKFIAQEKMTYSEARNINSFEDLKEWCHGKNMVKKIDVIVYPAEESKEVSVEMSEKKTETVEKVKSVLNEPLPQIDMSKVNVIKSDKTHNFQSGKNKLGKKIAESVLSQL